MIIIHTYISNIPPNVPQKKELEKRRMGVIKNIHAAATKSGIVKDMGIASINMRADSQEHILIIADTKCGSMIQFATNLRDALEKMDIPVFVQNSITEFYTKP